MSSLIDLFKEALVYPTKDYKALVIFGVLFLIANLSSVLLSFSNFLYSFTLLWFLSLESSSNFIWAKISFFH